MDQPVQNDKKAKPFRIRNVTDENFWRSFTVFSCSIEKFCVQRWYIFLLTLYVAQYLIAFLKDIDYGIRKKDAWLLLSTQHFQESSVYAQSTIFLYVDREWCFHAVVIGLFLLLAAYNSWSQHIPNLFRCLEHNHTFTAPRQLPGSNYQKYRTNYQSALLYVEGIVSKAIVITGVFLISIIIFGWYGFVLDYLPVLRQDIFQWGSVAVPLEICRRLIKDVFYPSLFIALGVSCIWTITITGLYIRKFTHEFSLEIQPAHSDKCGGFKFLGTFLLKIALLIMATSTVLGFYCWYRTQFPHSSIWAISATTALLFGIFSSYAAFFVPMGAVHQMMKKKREEYETMFECRRSALEERIRNALYHDDPGQLQEARDALDRIQEQDPDKMGYTRWPFDQRVFITFLISQIAPLVGLLTAIFNLVVMFGKYK
ncbi:hypothetical protein [Dictyobacter formicarum]|nr:hypothetical protein [Dictyobacter formicarum]